MPKVELTSEIIGELKQVYPKLFKISQSDQDFIIKPLNRGEWLYLQEMAKANPKMSLLDVDDNILRQGLVWPKWDPSVEFMNMPAGVIPSLSQYIQAKSGFRNSLSVGVEEEYEVLQDNPYTWESPSDKDIEGYKAKYNLPMSKVTLDKQVFILRAIKRTEWNEINSKGLSQDSAEYALLEKALVYPEKDKLAQVLPGCISTLVENVIQLSGYKDEPISCEEL